MDSLRDAINTIRPKSLDDIIRSNRDKMRAYLSTEVEIEALCDPIPERSVTGVISHWNFVSFLLATEPTPMIYLTGYNEAAHSSWMTSLVLAIRGNAVATTSGSLYMLEGEKSVEPDLEYICATLHQWGIGPRFDVPLFFF